jgi:hypothetical protein
MTEKKPDQNVDLDHLIALDVNKGLAEAAASMGDIDLDHLIALDVDKGLAEAAASMGDIDLDHLIDVEPRSTEDLKLRLKEYFKENHDRYLRAAVLIATKIAEEPQGSLQLAEMLKKQKAIRRVLDQIRRI